MSKYNLGFISDEDIFRHVRDTVLSYRFAINLTEFNSNLIDPIKLTFDSKVYKKRFENVLEGEIIRQLDKSNTNHIGYFHQNIFNYIGNGWVVPPSGYDVVNEGRNIFVEMKNKHNTMNSSSSQRTYIRMQATLINNPNATCMLVEVIATHSQNIAWAVSVDGRRCASTNIRRVSIDNFYKIATGTNNAFMKLCMALPAVIGDVVNTVRLPEQSNTVLQELQTIDNNLLKSIYLLSFRNYEGFHDFDI